MHDPLNSLNMEEVAKDVAVFFKDSYSMDKKLNNDVRHFFLAELLEFDIVCACQPEYFLPIVCPLSRSPKNSRRKSGILRTSFPFF